MGELGAQAEGLLDLIKELCGCCDERGKEDWRICHSRFVPLEDANKASNQSRQEGDLWQSGDGKGKASKKDCEGVSSSGVEEEHLIRIISRLSKSESSV